MLDETKKHERICTVCGKTHKDVCILKIRNNGKEVLKCTKCILFESENALAHDTLSGSFTFIDGELGMTEYHLLLDEAEDDLKNLDSFEDDYQVLDGFFCDIIIKEN
jgi:hypothetical protein